MSNQMPTAGVDRLFSRALVMASTNLWCCRVTAVIWAHVLVQVQPNICAQHTSLPSACQLP
uniref:Uncharacterized protein n=1 Tax=Anguilla anguilla TaxID=7936 RepID=A0A0E9X025_ANGAN